MRRINIGDVKRNFSRLIKEEGFVISKAGKPKVKVIPIDGTESQASPTTRSQGWAKDARKV